MRDISFLKNKLIAHRGYHNITKQIPENSNLAFQEAIKNDLIIELDIHLMKDGNVIVFHDDNLKRMTGIDKNIKDCNYEQIKNLKLLNTNQNIPLLSDVLKLINGKVPVIIELKCDTKCGKLEKKAYKLLENYKGKYAIKSFSPFSVMYFRKHYPNVTRGQLASDFKNRKLLLIKKILLKNLFFNCFTKPDFVSYDIRALPNKKVKKFRKQHLVLGWTIRNKDDLEYAKKYCDNYICENINMNKSVGDKDV